MSVPPVLYEAPLPTPRGLGAPGARRNEPDIDTAPQLRRSTCVRPYRRVPHRSLTYRGKSPGADLPPPSSVLALAVPKVFLHIVKVHDVSPASLVGLAQG